MNDPVQRCIVRCCCYEEFQVQVVCIQYLIKKVAFMSGSCVFWQCAVCLQLRAPWARQSVAPIYRILINSRFRLKQKLTSLPPHCCVFAQRITHCIANQQCTGISMCIVFDCMPNLSCSWWNYWRNFFFFNSSKLNKD